MSVKSKAKSTPKRNVLTKRARNRALLARQLLLERDRERSVADVVEHLVGMQAQVPEHPYFALWARLEHFEANELATLIRTRKAVRLALMRSTIHLVTTRDALRLRAPMHAAIERSFNGSPWRKQIGDDVAQVVARGRVLVEEEAMTNAQLGARLAREFRGNAEALGYSVRTFAALVQVPPRGEWQKSGATKHTTLESFVGKPQQPSSLSDVLARYFRAFGPATIRDAQAWSGLLDLEPVIGTMSLRAFVDEEGRALYDVEDGAFVDADVPAPVRFLPTYDNVLLAHVDRSHMIDDAHRKTLTSPNGVGPGTVLVDGFVKASWTLTKPTKKSHASISVTALEKLTKKERDEVVAEGERVLRAGFGEGRVDFTN